MPGYFKILLIGDPHFMEGFLNELKIAVEELKKNIPNDLDFVVIMGDLLDKHDKIDTYSKRDVDMMIVELSKLVKKVYVLIGNHDRPIESEFLTDNHVFNLLKISTNVIVADTIITDYVKSEKDGLHYKFVFAPYVSPERFYEACQICNINPPFDDCVAVFLHQEFGNYSLSKLTGSQIDHWEWHYPLAYSGHIHTYNITDHNLIYTGSFIQTNYGDSVDKSLSLIEIAPPERISREHYVLPEESYLLDKQINRNYLVSNERIYLNVPRRLTAKITAEEFENYVMPKNCKIKISIECGKNVFNELKKMTKFKELELNGATIINTDTNKLQYVMTRTEQPCILNDYKNVKLEKINFSSRIENRIKNEPKFKQIYDELFS